ncbi:hypothetical protein F4779DRAFT_519047 [Xylariaceae sp. FL0662B]|nr:hypothetical protein F4779DRAFT_519047 [Xylariaceae sp. FL0662B]
MKRLIFKLKKKLLRRAPLTTPLQNVTTHENPPLEQTNAPIENLPPEIRRQILSTLSLEELNCFIRASPVFHCQYLENRRYLLCACLENTLGSVSVDALVVHQTKSPDFLMARTDESIAHVLEYYQNLRMEQDATFQGKLSETDAIQISAFYFSITRPIGRHYFRWALDNLAGETRVPPTYEPISTVEETRLLRALYRFQICCGLFGRNDFHDSLRHRWRPDGLYILKVFIGLFEPWEVEEIACICTFSQDTYEQIFREIQWDVDEKNPKFDGQRPPTPDGAFNLASSFVRECLLKGIVSRGLEMLHTVLFTIKDHSHLVSTMQRSLASPVGDFLLAIGDALDETTQVRRRREALSDRDRKEEARDPLPFEGDTETRPPLAWTLIWGGTYSNLYGYYVEDEIRRWGYVLWDASRLKRSGAEDVLHRQWYDMWGDDDPRDVLIV